MMTVLTALRDGCRYQCDTEKAGGESPSQGPAESKLGSVKSRGLFLQPSSPFQRFTQRPTPLSTQTHPVAEGNLKHTLSRKNLWFS